MTNLGTHMYDWLLHFNPHTELWEAVKRDHYHQLFSGGTNIVRSSSLTTLVDIINKTDGDDDKLSDLTFNYDSDID